MNYIHINIHYLHYITDNIKYINVRVNLKSKNNWASFIKIGKIKKDIYRIPKNFIIIQK